MARKIITPIIESSETENDSNSNVIVNDQASLDDLFDTLESEIVSLNHSAGPGDEANEFETIKKSLKNIPKLSSSLDNKSFDDKTGASFGQRQVIYDPITVIPKKDKEAEDSGKDWFNMPKPEITKEVKNDLLVLSKRDVLDPKRHYKKQKWVQPKYFQIGEIINDNYSRNLNRKQKGTSIINELLVDDDTRKYFKRKYNEIQEVKTSGKMKDYKKQQKMRRKF